MSTQCNWRALRPNRMRSRRQYLQPDRQKTTGRPSTALRRCASSAPIDLGKIRGEFTPASSTNTSRSAAAAPGFPLKISPVATTEPQSTSSIGRIQARVMMTQAIDESARHDSRTWRRTGCARGRERGRPDETLPSGPFLSSPGFGWRDPADVLDRLGSLSFPGAVRHGPGWWMAAVFQFDRAAVRSRPGVRITASPGVTGTGRDRAVLLAQRDRREGGDRRTRGAWWPETGRRLSRSVQQMRRPQPMERRRSPVTGRGRVRSPFSVERSSGLRPVRRPLPVTSSGVHGLRIGSPGLGGTTTARGSS